jgi:hypothetical protein
MEAWHGTAIFRGKALTELTTLCWKLHAAPFDTALVIEALLSSFELLKIL